MRPWDPDQPIEELFNHCNRCRSFARKGKDPISDESYARILIEIFNKSGVLERAVEEWEMKDEEDQTLANTITHFTKANKHRLQRQTSLKSSLRANNAALAQPGQAKKPGYPEMFEESMTHFWYGYCLTHGLGQHHSHQCNRPAKGHHHDATIGNRIGGNATIHRHTNVRNKVE
jgi:hypothetical protein